MIEYIEQDFNFLHGKTLDESIRYLFLNGFKPLNCNSRARVYTSSEKDYVVRIAISDSCYETHMKNCLRYSLLNPLFQKIHSSYHLKTGEHISIQEKLMPITKENYPDVKIPLDPISSYSMEIDSEKKYITTLNPVIGGINEFLKVLKKITLFFDKKTDILRMREAFENSEFIYYSDKFKISNLFLSHLSDFLNIYITESSSNHGMNLDFARNNSMKNWGFRNNLPSLETLVVFDPVSFTETEEDILLKNFFSQVRLNDTEKNYLYSIADNIDFFPNAWTLRERKALNI